jgi:hypothetical protein
VPSPSEAGDSRPPERESRSAPAPGSPEEALRRLEQRLDQATEAAERLMAQVAGEAARTAAAAAGNPATGAGNTTADQGNRAAGRQGNPAADDGDPAADDGNPAGDDGNQAANEDNTATGAADAPNPPPAGWQTADDARNSTPELDPFVALVQAMRDLIPPDLQQRLIAALREVLLALRALIDWYLERIDRGRGHGTEVQDIPIR